MLKFIFSMIILAVIFFCGVGFLFTAAVVNSAMNENDHHAAHK